ncbi:HTTM domain-containing protein [Streptomyces sp. ISL-10]|uniref:HTTM domain-containing protein n=1 Tax=Streptomyces sp. ISL-10 TaxID=2819172 RepID=UPI001BEBA951|nr:HTTM domain-containing protein [Streptomyces sp. ISL-10]MBT2367302.1 HTTM domain-containing protein [Streptomyces sp. ISL-10]
MTTTVERGAARAIQRITATAFGPYQTAIVRIGFGTTWLVFLLVELPHRHQLYGPEGPWSWDMGRELVANNNAFTGLLWSDSSLWFETVYGLSIVASLLLILGWRTRAASALFMFGVLSLQNRSIFVGDGGDNVVHLMAIYLVLTRCAQVWSLDARRAGRVVPGAPSRDRVGPLLWAVLGVGLVVGTSLNETGPFVLVLLWALWVAQGLWWLVCRYAPRGEPRVLLDVLANVVHNGALVVIMAEVCLIYATAGWYKIQGSRWQDGTALYYPLELDYFTPWPALSGILAGSALLVLVLTYGTVIVQVAFPFTLFNRRVKNVLLVAMILEHAGIAVLLGLPIFSLSMIAADAVFLPTAFLVWLGARAARARDRLLSRKPDPGQPEGETGEVPRTLVG